MLMGREDEYQTLTMIRLISKMHSYIFLLNTKIVNIHFNQFSSFPVSLLKSLQENSIPL